MTVKHNREKGTGSIEKRNGRFYLKLRINGTSRTTLLRDENDNPVTTRKAAEEAAKRMRPILRAQQKEEIAVYIAEARKMKHEQSVSIEDIWTTYLALVLYYLHAKTMEVNMATTRLRTWEITDEFWAKVETYIPNDLRCPGVNYRRKPGGGRKSRYGNRLYFSAIVYVLRTGIIWNALPRKEFENITSQAVHKKFMQWSRAGFFQKLWHAGLMEYDEMEGIAWEWQSADGSHGKAPLAQELAGANPTDRGKQGSKKKSTRRRSWHPVVDRRNRSQQA